MGPVSEIPSCVLCLYDIATHSERNVALSCVLSTTLPATCGRFAVLCVCAPLGFQGYVEMPHRIVPEVYDNMFSLHS